MSREKCAELFFCLCTLIKLKKSKINPYKLIKDKRQINKTFNGRKKIL